MMKAVSFSEHVLFFFFFLRALPWPFGYKETFLLGLAELLMCNQLRLLELGRSTGSHFTVGGRGGGNNAKSLKPVKHLSHHVSTFSSSRIVIADKRRKKQVELMFSISTTGVLHFP